MNFDDDDGDDGEEDDELVPAEAGNPWTGF